MYTNVPTLLCKTRNPRRRLRRLLLARPAGGWLASLATTPGAPPHPHTLSSTIKISKIALFRFLASGDLGGPPNSRSYRSIWSRALERPRMSIWGCSLEEVIIILQTGWNYLEKRFLPWLFDTPNSTNQITASEAAEAGFIWLITSALICNGCIQSFNLLALKLRPWWGKIAMFQTSWEFSFGFQNCWKGCVNLNFLNTLCRIKVNTKTKTGWGHTHCRQVLVSHLVVHNCQRKLWLLWTVENDF